MALDTDNNFIVSGATQEGQVATDFISSAHHQVVKVAFGDSSTATRVTSSAGLPVDVKALPALSSTVTGTVNVQGVAAGTLLGVTATNLSIRSLTGGNPLGSTLTTGADHVRVYGISGAWPVGITAGSVYGLSIRGLSGGNPTGSTLTDNADHVRVYGVSGAWPVGITAGSVYGLSIRGLSGGNPEGATLTQNADHVRVYGVSGGYPIAITASSGGLNIRSLTGGDPTASTLSLNNDSVRVFGVSGAFPIGSLMQGRSGGSINTLKVDESGSLFVNLSSGAISLTANVSGLSLSPNIVITGVSSGDATGLTGVLQVRGYTGQGAYPIFVHAWTGAGNTFTIRGLSFGTDSISVTGGVRVVGSDTSPISVTGSYLSKLNSLVFAGQDLQVVNTGLNTSLTSLSTNIGNVDADTSIIVDALSSGASSNKQFRVDVISIAQPNGITSGRITATSSGAQLPSFALKSGVHLKSHINNTTGTIFVATNASDATNGIGYPLYNADQIFIETDNTNKIFYASNPTGLTLYYIGT